MFKGKAPIIFAIVLAIVSAVLAWRAIKVKEREVTEGWELRRVLVASETIAPGTLLTESNVARGEMPANFVYDSVILPDELQSALNAEVIVPIHQGEPIHWYQLQGLREASKLSTAVRPGFRAITINVDDAASVGRWVRPNDIVDLIGTFRDPLQRELTALTLMQQVTVLATGSTSTSISSSSENNNYNNVTLMVMPQEAELLTLAQEMGTLRLALRNREDLATLEKRGRTTLDSLTRDERLIELDQARRAMMTIIRGGLGAQMPR